MPNEEQSPFKNPYEGIPPADIHRTTIEIDRHAHSDLHRCRSRKGTLQTTLNILLNKLTEQLKKHGLTEYDPERYEYAVANATLTLGVHDSHNNGVRGTVADAGPQAVNRNDGFGTLGMARPTPGPSVESSDVAGALAQPSDKNKVKRAKRNSGRKATPVE